MIKRVEFTPTFIVPSLFVRSGTRSFLMRSLQKLTLNETLEIFIVQHHHAYEKCLLNHIDGRYDEQNEILGAMGQKLKLLDNSVEHFRPVYFALKDLIVYYKRRFVVKWRVPAKRL